MPQCCSVVHSNYLTRPRGILSIPAFRNLSRDRRVLITHPQNNFKYLEGVYPHMHTQQSYTISCSQSLTTPPLMLTTKSDSHSIRATVRHQTFSDRLSYQIKINVVKTLLCWLPHKYAKWAEQHRVKCKKSEQVKSL